MVALLTGLSPTTVFANSAEIHRQCWVWNLRTQSQPPSGESARHTGDHEFAVWSPPLGGDVPAIGGDVHSDVPAVGGGVHSGLPGLPKDDPAAEFLLGIDGDMPATGGVGLLPQWRARAQITTSACAKQNWPHFGSLPVCQTSDGRISDLVCQNGPRRFGQCES